MNAEAYPFELSLAELDWLAGALGIASLPLPDGAAQGMTAEQRRQRQKDGHASLRTRGLLRPSPSVGWQAERLPAALLHWIASAASLLRLERIPRAGPARRLHLFTAGEEGLSLEVNGETARFVIFPSRRLLHQAALGWLALPVAPQKSALALTLPQPLAFLPVAWKEPSLAARILKEHSLEAPSALAWAASLEWAAALSRVEVAAGRNTLAVQFVLCSDGQSLWGGREEETKVSFAPVTAKMIVAKINEMVQQL